MISGLSKLLLPLASGFWGLFALVVLEGIGAGTSLPAHRPRPRPGGWLTDLGGIEGAFYLAGSATVAGATALAWLTRPSPATS